MRWASSIKAYRRPRMSVVGGVQSGCVVPVGSGFEQTHRREHGQGLADVLPVARIPPDPAERPRSRVFPCRSGRYSAMGSAAARLPFVSLERVRWAAVVRSSGARVCS